MWLVTWSTCTENGATLSLEEPHPADGTLLERFHCVFRDVPKCCCPRGCRSVECDCCYCSCCNFLTVLLQKPPNATLRLAAVVELWRRGARLTAAAFIATAAAAAGITAASEFWQCHASQHVVSCSCRQFLRCSGRLLWELPLCFTEEVNTQPKCRLERGWNKAVRLSQLLQSKRPRSVHAGQKAFWFSRRRGD